MHASDPQRDHPQRALARVSLPAVAANVELLRSKLTGGAELCAVVKSDAYGHGLEEVARAAVAAGATRLAVVTDEEAARVAALGLDAALLVLAPIQREQLAAVIATGAELTVWSERQVREVAEAALAAGSEVRLHVKLDTGMGRFGAREVSEALAALELAEQLPGVRGHAVWTHFATADLPDDAYFDEQLAAFTGFVRAARERHPGLLAHAANSAALLREAASHFDFARAGIAIYGLDPFGSDAAKQGLAPALSLHSFVASVREVAKGESVGYGRKYIALEDTRIATVPIGYGDGWRRILSNNCDVLIAGRRHPQRGTISMDSVMVELGDESPIGVGEPVTLIGSQGDAQISTEEVAERAQTINYEITCGLTTRTIREYAAG